MIDGTKEERERAERQVLIRRVDKFADEAWAHYKKDAIDLQVSLNRLQEEVRESRGLLTRVYADRKQDGYHDDLQEEMAGLLGVSE